MINGEWDPSLGTKITDYFSYFRRVSCELYSFEHIFGVMSIA